MSISVFIFAIWTLVGAAILLAMTWIALDLGKLEFKQLGETSLGRNSINWLASIAFLTAAAICLLAS